MELWGGKHLLEPLQLDLDVSPITILVLLRKHMYAVLDRLVQEQLFGGAGGKNGGALNRVQDYQVRKATDVKKRGRNMACPITLLRWALVRRPVEATNALYFLCLS